MEDKAKTIANLKKCRDEYLERMDDCEVVIFQWKSGGRSGIGNPEMKQKILQFCADEAQRQIDVLEGRKPEKYLVALMFNEDAVREYESNGIDGLNEYLESEDYPDLDIRERQFDSEELMKAYLDGINEFAGDERAPGSWCVIDYDDLDKLRYE